MFRPVIKSFEKVRDQEPSALHELLNNERGQKFFELYLATELSLENLLFYRSVQRWKKKYQEGSVETSEEATLILDLYLKNGATSRSTSLIRSRPTRRRRLKKAT